MKEHILLFLVIGSNIMHINGNANKCNSVIISSINNLWSGKIPTGIIQSSITNDKEVVVWTTNDYFETGTKCVYSYFQTDTFTFSVVPEIGKEVSTVVNIKEKEGTLINLDTNVVRYQAFNHDGVAAFYKCHENGPAGEPKGYIKVRASGYEKKSVDDAKAALEGLGLKMSKSFPSTCP